VLSALGGGEVEGIMFLLSVCCGELLVVLRIFSASAVIADDRGIEDDLVICLSDDGWLDLDETLEFRRLGLEYLLVLVLVMGMVPLDLFITRMVRRAGVIQ